MSAEVTYRAKLALTVQSTDSISKFVKPMADLLTNVKSAVPSSTASSKLETRARGDN
jgi:hypothetical protein